jgi:hypothetical protein
VVKGITTTVLNGERSSVWKITAGRRPALLVVILRLAKFYQPHFAALGGVHG